MEKFKEGQKLTVISLNKTVFAVEYLPDELHLKCRWLEDNNDMKSDTFHIAELKLYEQKEVKRII